jgi:hypothetical protein
LQLSLVGIPLNAYPAGKALRHMDENQAPAAHGTGYGRILFTNGSSCFVLLHARLLARHTKKRPDSLQGTAVT